MIKNFIKLSFLLLVSVFVINFSSNVYIDRSVSIEHCNLSNIENYEIQNSNIRLPESINIHVNKTKTWIKNLLNIMNQMSITKIARIPYELKDYYDARIDIKYSNGIQCYFNGRVKIHGANHYHINDSLAPSLRVELFDGHINNINNFVLYKQWSRLKENEIFIAALLRHLGFLSPLTFGIKVKYLHQRYEYMIFQERLNEQFLKSYKKRPGPILAGNKNRFSDSKIRNTGLSRIINSGGLDFSINDHKEIALKALDKLNFGYLYFRKSYETLGRNGGTIMSNMPLPKSLFLDDDTGYKTMGAFEAILIASGAESGLTKEDRRFYYNAIYDRLEPIYYDGKARIFDNFNLELDEYYFISDFQKLGAKKARLLLLNLDEVYLYEYLKNLRIEYFIEKLSLEKIHNTLKILDENLIKIENTNFTSDHIEPDKNNFFANNRFSNENEYDFSLAFNGKNNKFLICDIDLISCENNIFNEDEFNRIITNQFMDFKGKKIRFVRKDLNSFVQNTNSIKSGIKGMKKIQLDNSINIYFGNEIEIKISETKKNIRIKQNNITDSVVVIGNNINDWNFHFEGYGTREVDYKIDSNGIGGCITFLDSVVENISIFAQNMPCPNAVHFINTNGTINKVELFNSSSDAFDADFSNLEVNHANIVNTGGECIGVKQGTYFFNKLNLSNCGDRSVSSGENAETTLIDIEVLSANVGLAAKDSSIIEAKKVILRNVQKCILSFKQKNNYSASLVKTNKDNYFCSNDSFDIQKNSSWINN